MTDRYTKVVLTLIASGWEENVNRDYPGTMRTITVNAPGFPVTVK